MMTARDRTLTVNEARLLWKTYMANRSNVDLRDRLVEHYAPWVQSLIEGMARNINLADRENAIGEGLFLLTQKIIPQYDGRGKFEGWASICLRRRIVDLWRRQRQLMVSLQTPSGDGDEEFTEMIDLLPAPSERLCDLRFCELTAQLTNREALVLWLRYYRGLTIDETAKELDTANGTIRSRTYAAIKKLRNSKAAAKFLPD